MTSASTLANPVLILPNTKMTTLYVWCLYPGLFDGVKTGSRLVTGCSERADGKFYRFLASLSSDQSFCGSLYWLDSLRLPRKDAREEYYSLPLRTEAQYLRTEPANSRD
jgi:hypothetical protein